MSPGGRDEETVEVRLRYRPVGDVLTVSVRSEAPPGPIGRTELDDATSIEWTRRPDGTEQMTALQLLDARSSITDGRGFDVLPEALRAAALDLIDPGRHHHDHPSTHRPTHPTATHDSWVRTTADALVVALPRAAGGRHGPG
ncbi:MAG: hypothetical protein MUE36_08390 [Acidimicrobiales bacterium]|jgi:hypothetical protein|nr:hypothetical protein [Acidimicrobiales bacterium]